MPASLRGQEETIQGVVAAILDSVMMSGLLFVCYGEESLVLVTEGEGKGKVC
jgi:hypothetical protein